MLPALPAAGAGRGDQDPGCLAALAERYLTWMASSGFSEVSVHARRPVLGYFLRWCEERDVTRPTEVTRPLLERYQRWLYNLRRPSGAALSLYTQSTRLQAVKAYFKWLARENRVLYNPAAELLVPRVTRRLPRFVLTAEEVERVLALPDVLRPVGLRDRAIMETLYSTGVRRQELIRLRLYDLDQERGTLMVAQGKGRKDRVVPIGDRAVGWVLRYLADARPHFVLPPDEGVLFLTVEHGPVSRNHLTQLVTRYVRASGVGKPGSCHLFRHTVATLMLENGADVRYVQELLGHAQLSTTQVYTHVSIRKLKEVHQATHPAQVGMLERPGQPAHDDERAQLLEALAAEAKGEERS